MSRIAEALAGCAAWEEPKLTDGYPFKLACRLEPPAAPEEVHEAWPAVPASIAELWATTRAADLFIDVEHGQWGLRLLAPGDSARRSAQERAGRPDDVRADDVVVGEFLGDQDLLVVDSDGRPLIALPLDERKDWDCPAKDIAEFLGRFVAADGDKYWER